MKVAECVRGVQAGQKHGDRIVLGCPFTIGTYANSKLLWAVVVQCKCGRVSVVRLANLKHGAADRCRSCHSQIANTKHGGSPSLQPRERLHNIWCGMRQRCNSETCHAYPNYGGRGITVCRDWDDYSAFRRWALRSGYWRGLSIDRIDNDKGYSPDNCQWITKSENSKKQHTDRKNRCA